MKDMISEKFAEREVIDIANAVTRHSYSISRLGMSDLFKKITAADYVTLSKLFERMNLADGGSLLGACQSWRVRSKSAVLWCGNMTAQARKARIFR